MGIFAHFLESHAFLPQKRYRIAFILFLLFCILIPFPNTYSNLALALILLIGVFSILKFEDFVSFRIHWYLPVLFLYFVISELATNGNWGSIEKRLLLLLVPIAFSLYPFTRQELFRIQIYKAFIAGNTLAILICTVRAIVRSTSLTNGDLVFNSKVIPNSQYDFFTSSVMGGNYFFSDEFSFFLHPTYFSILIAFCLYLIFHLSDLIEIRFKKWLGLLYIVLFISLFMLSSKSVIFSAILLTVVISLQMEIAFKGKIIIVIVVLIASLVTITYNPKLKVFRDTLKTHSAIDPNARFGHDLRILSWNTALSIIKENWLLGVGEGRKKEALVNAYKEKGYVYPAQEGHNSHNQYLDFLLGGGIFGLTLFMSGVLQLLFKSIHDRNFVLPAFLFIFLFNCLTENLMSRYSGLLFFSFFIALHTTDDSNTKERCS